jgi:hypothetical protein
VCDARSYLVQNCCHKSAHNGRNSDLYSPHNSAHDGRNSDLYSPHKSAHNGRNSDLYSPHNSAEILTAVVSRRHAMKAYEGVEECLHHSSRRQYVGISDEHRPPVIPVATSREESPVLTAWAGWVGARLHAGPVRRTVDIPDCQAVSGTTALERSTFEDTQTYMRTDSKAIS